MRDSINQIMCNGLLDFEQTAAKHGCSVDDFLKITKFNVSRIDQLLNDKLVEFKNNTLTVKPEGMLIVRNVAVAFDPAFTLKEGQYSNTL